MQKGTAVTYKKDLERGKKIKFNAFRKHGVTLYAVLSHQPSTGGTSLQCGAVAPAMIYTASLLWLPGTHQSLIIKCLFKIKYSSLKLIV